MNNTWKKTAAFVLALALVAGAAPTDFGGFINTQTSITAYAATYYATKNLKVGDVIDIDGGINAGSKNNYTINRPEKTNDFTLTAGGEPWSNDTGKKLIVENKSNNKIILKYYAEPSVTFDNWEYGSSNTPVVYLDSNETIPISDVVSEEKISFTWQKVSRSWTGTTYTDLSAMPTDVGTYRLNVTIDLSGTDYRAKGSGSSVSTTVTCTKDFSITTKSISADDLTVNVDADNCVYTGSALKPTVTVMYGDTEIPSSEYSLVYSNNTNAGTATVTVKDATNGNYAIGQKAVNFTIKKATPTITTAPTPKTGLAYTGSAQALVTAGTVPTTGTNRGKMQYRVGENGTWSDSVPTETNAGTYQVYYKAVTTQTNKTNYGDTEVFGPIEVSIAPKSVTNPTVEGISDRTYNGSQQTFDNIVVKDGSKTIPSTEYIVEYSNNTNAGQGTVKITDNEGGNYTISEKTVNFNIAQAAIVKTDFTEPVGAGEAAWTYDGDSHDLLSTAGSCDKGTFKYSVNGGDWQTDAPTAINAGDYTIRWYIDGDSNHSDYGSAEQPAGTINVSSNSASMSNVVSATGYQDAYDGQAHGITVTAPNGATVLYSEDGVNYSSEEIKYTDYTGGPVKVYYKVTKDNYVTVTGDATVNILRRAVTVTPDEDVTSKVFGDADPEEFKYTADGLIDGDELSGNITRAAGVTVGDYAFDISNLSTGDNDKNYDIKLATGSKFSITAKTVVIKPKAASKTYGDADPEFEYETEGLVEDYPLGGTLSRTAGSNVDEYDFAVDTLTGPNYNITLADNSPKFSITAKDITVTPTKTSKVFGEADPDVFTYEADGLIEGDELSGSITRADGEDVGDYTFINGLSNNNYNISLADDLVFKITPKSIAGAATVEFADRITEFEHTGEEITPEFTVKIGDNPLTKDTDYEVSGDITKTEEGNYTITITGKGNYTGEVDASWKIIGEEAIIKPHINFTYGKESAIADNGGKISVNATANSDNNETYQILRTGFVYYNGVENITESNLTLDNVSTETGIKKITATDGTSKQGEFLDNGKGIKVRVYSDVLYKGNVYHIYSDEIKTYSFRELVKDSVKDMVTFDYDTPFAKKYEGNRVVLGVTANSKNEKCTVVKTNMIYYNGEGSLGIDAFTLDNPNVKTLTAADGTTKKGQILDNGYGVTGRGYAIVSYGGFEFTVYNSKTTSGEFAVLAKDLLTPQEKAESDVTVGYKIASFKQNNGDRVLAGTNTTIKQDSEFSIVRTGLIYYNANKNAPVLTVEGIGKNNVKGIVAENSLTKNGQLLDNGYGVTVRGYSVVKDSNNKEYTVYGEQTYYSFREMAQKAVNKLVNVGYKDVTKKYNNGNRILAGTLTTIPNDGSVEIVKTGLIYYNADDASTVAKDKLIVGNIGKDNVKGIESTGKLKCNGQLLDAGYGVAVRGYSVVTYLDREFTVYGEREYYRYDDTNIPDVSIAVTGVTLNKTSLNMTVNGTENLIATVTPANAANVTWTSNNESVATVDQNGLVTAKVAGTATIKATAGGKDAYCAVTVHAPVEVHESGQLAVEVK